MFGSSQMVSDKLYFCYTPFTVSAYHQKTLCILVLFTFNVQALYKVSKHTYIIVGVMGCLTTASLISKWTFSLYIIF